MVVARNLYELEVIENFQNHIKNRWVSNDILYKIPKQTTLLKWKTKK